MGTITQSARLPRRQGTFSARVGSLRVRASAGDASAWWELGCLLGDGDVDARGRVSGPPDHRGAFLAFRRGADLGDASALLNLGVCYDSGRGTRRNRAAARSCYQRVWRGTRDCSAAANLATWYRDAGDDRRALAWYVKAAAAGDGDAYVDIAYGYYYGVGTNRNIARAVSALGCADHAPSITPYSREEASYMRAVILVDRGRRDDTAAAASLLQQAAADGDYPEADAVLRALVGGLVPSPCRCRRHWKPTVRGQAPCPLHPRTERRRRRTR